MFTLPYCNIALAGLMTNSEYCEQYRDGFGISLENVFLLMF